jgi:tetratricopeptide (TPR) repeat protein
VHKREKREYGVFYSSCKNSGISTESIITQFLRSFFILILFINTLSVFFLLTSVSSSYAFRASDIQKIINGFIYENYGNYNKSLGISKNILKKSDSAGGYYYLAKLYLKNKNFKKAKYYIDKTIKISHKKNKIHYYILKTKIYLNENKIKKSLNTLNFILKKYPYNRHALLLIAGIYKFQKKFTAASYYLNLLKLYYPNDIDSYYELSKIYIKENKPAKAIKNLKEVAKLNPYFKESYFQLAAIYTVIGKEKQALSILKKYLKYNPHSNFALYQSGLINYAVKNYTLSRKYFFRLLHSISIGKINLRNNSYFFIGASYYFQNNYPESIKYLSMVKYGQHYVDSRFQEIEIYLALNNKAQNHKYNININYIINKLIKNKKLEKNLKVYYFSAISLIEIKQYREAKNVLNKGLEYFPKNTALLYQLGSDYHFLHNNKKSIKIMNRVLEINPMSADALNFKGYYLAAHKKNIIKAKKLIKKALSIKPDSPYIMDSMGFVYLRLKEYKKALLYFKRSLKKLKNSSVVLRHTGMDYLMLKNYGKAKKYLKLSEKIKKSNETLKYLKKLKNTIKDD